MQRRWMLSSLAAAALLVACGGSDNDDAIVGRGTLIDTPAVVATFTAAQINAQATS